MSAIRNFFQKKKMDIKFKQAGQGQRLGDSSQSQSQARSQSQKQGAIASSSGVRKPPSESSAKAAQAALARFESQAQQNAKSRPVSATTSWKHSATTPSTSNPIVDPHKVKQEVKRELAAEAFAHRKSEKQKQRTEEVQFSETPTFSVSGITYICPMCPVSLPQDEMNNHIEHCLYKELEQEPAMVAASMIHTLNEDKGQVRACVEILNKYLNNIISSPSEEKYRKVKQGNKVFREKVAPLKGIKELLTIAVGFVDVKLPMQVEGKETEEAFYVLSEGLALDTDRLTLIKEYINEAEPLTASLDRNVRVFKAVVNMPKFNLPPDFYKLTAEEIKNQQLRRSESVEKEKQLRTKAMREADAAQVKKIYKFTLIRIRFPDGTVLQGTFYSNEKLSELRSFVKESLELDWIPFELADGTGQKLNDDNKTLQEYGLSPAAVLNFAFDAQIVTDIAASSSGNQSVQYLTIQLLSLIQPLE